MYKTTVRSVIDYGILVYYHSLTQADKNRIDKLQYNASKLVSSTLHYTSRIKIEQELGWESISKRAEFLGLTLFQKIHCNQTRPHIKNCMPLISNRASDQTNTCIYQQFPFKGVLFSNSFFPYMTKKWNNLPQSLKIKPIDEFKLGLKGLIKPKKYKFYSSGDKYKSSLLTRIWVGRSFLNEHSFTLGFSPSMACDKCSAPRESPLHFITQCESFSHFRLIMLEKVRQFIPNILNLSKRRQFEILVTGYESPTQCL